MYDDLAEDLWSDYVERTKLSYRKLVFMGCVLSFLAGSWLLILREITRFCLWVSQ